jgi:DNA-binding MarR family transcriptional regulator
VTADASPPYRFGDLLALARASWVRQLRTRMDASGFPGYRPTDSWMLRLLGQQALAFGQLGDAMGVTRQAARKLAQGMVERGYVTFSSDPADARRTLVVLTRSGRNYARAVAGAQDALNDTVRHRVSEVQLQVADTVLRAVFSDEIRRRVDASVPRPGRGRGPAGEPKVAPRKRVPEPGRR